MMAVTECSSKSIVMSRIASFVPYQAESPSVRTFAAMLKSPRHGSQPDDDPGRDADGQHDEDEDEGRPPRRLILGRRRAEREHVDRVRQGLDRMVEAREPKRAAERGHQQRGRLASDSRDAQERSG